jgi:hypothetical protein
MEEVRLVEGKVPVLSVYQDVGVREARAVSRYRVVVI